MFYLLNKKGCAEKNSYFYMEDNGLERIYSIDAVKCIAIFIVVYFHTTTFNVVQSDDISIWILAFPRFIIPYFFIVSGFLFGEKLKVNLNRINYFKTYTINLTRLFVGWYIFYLIYDLVIGVFIALARGYSLKAELISFFKLVPSLSFVYYGDGITAYHLWFLTALIWSIVILFIFIHYKKTGLLLIVSFVLNMIGLFGQSYSGIYHLPIYTRDALFFGLFYVTAGYCISSHYEKITKKITKMKSITFFHLFLLSSLLQIIESFITVKILHGTEGGIGYYISTVPLTFSLFLLVLKMKKLGSSVLSGIGRNTLGIYVTHMLFISLFYLGLNFYDLEWLRNNMVFNLLLSLIIFALSYYFYRLTQDLRDKLSQLFFKVIPSMIKAVVMKKQWNSNWFI